MPNRTALPSSPSGRLLRAADDHMSLKRDMAALDLASQLVLFTATVGTAVIFAVGLI